MGTDSSARRLYLMNDRRTRPRRLVVSASLALISAALLGSPAPALGSCLPLHLGEIPETPSLVVFSGTVVSTTGAVTTLRVERWFSGAGPTARVTVYGGRGSADPRVVTSVDWAPVTGSAYVVVAQRSEDGRLTTQACQQARADEETLSSAIAAFGPGIIPATADAPAGAVRGVDALAEIGSALIVSVAIFVMVVFLR